MKPEQTIQRLLNAIKNGKFAWRKYGIREWHGITLQSAPRYNDISKPASGYNVYIYDYWGVKYAAITHDWERNETKLIYCNI